MGLKTSNNQVICSNCEEQVHANAVSCPYCNCDLKSPLATREMVPDSLREQFLLHTKNANAQQESVTRKVEKEMPKSAPLPQEVESEASESVFDVMVPLLAMLSGSFFLFFVLFLKLFSKGGKLVLEWHTESVPYFLIPAILLLVIGFISLSSSKSKS